MVNFHRIFHYFTADWVYTGKMTSWKMTGIKHGKYNPSGEINIWVRYPYEICSWCGKTKIEYSNWCPKAEFEYLAEGQNPKEEKD